jgi:hypothetical protein
MGGYLLPEESHHRKDSCRANFFWHGPNLKRKYHMASWDLLMRPKEAGGLGLTNTRVRNKCFLAKWIFKIENEVDTPCCNLLRRKYLRDKSFFSYKGRVSSQFWKGLIEAGEDCLKGLKYILMEEKLGSGRMFGLMIAP